MRASTLMCIASGLSCAAALKFRFYSVTETYSGGSPDLNTDQYWITTSTDAPDCGDFDKAQANMLPQMSDVSGAKEGARCEGCDENPMADWKITQLEWNNGDGVLGHYTIYKARNFNIVPATGEGEGTESKGKCVVDKSDTGKCSFGVGDNFQAQLQFVCDTGDAVLMAPDDK